MDDKKEWVVAPHVGAWIETSERLEQQDSTLSLPMWERGLKQVVDTPVDLNYLSLPMWERGLKLGVDG